MKKISVLLALFALFAAGLAAAQGALVTSITGTAQAQVGTGPARALRLGDEVQQGATVSTGGSSSLVMKFSDGQIAALTSNSRMTITAYQYNAQSGAGNILLSLVNGGMRAITGLIGRRSPSTVSYRAATATIGIRGTDVSIATLLGNVVVSVSGGEISFTFGGQTITVPAGQAVNGRADGNFSQAAARQILAQIPPDLAAAINGLEGLTNAINQAISGAGDSASGTPGNNLPVGGGAASKQ
jgi:hypothetical protein